MKKQKGSSAAYAGDGAGEQGFWPSYADMMSAVALILFFVMLLTYIQNLITSQSLKGTEEELAIAQAQLQLTQQEVADKQSELELISADLTAAQLDLDVQQARIDAQEADIALQESQIAQQQAQVDQQQSQIDQQRAQIEQQQAQIAQQQAQADQQQAYLDQTQAELAAVRSQMEQIAGIRMTVVNQIKNSIEQSMGSGNAVTVSDSGSLVLGESVLFASGKYELTGASYDVLVQLGHGLYEFLSDPANAQYVDTIVIGGHTDSTGSDSVNYPLSLNRAKAVLEQLFAANNGELQAYKQYFSAAGFGSTRPIASNDTAEGRAQNRRIEISITLKDDSVMSVLESYLSIGNTVG